MFFTENTTICFCISIAYVNICFTAYYGFLTKIVHFFRKKRLFSDGRFKKICIFAG